jgi:hypothetical protein
MCKKRFRQNSIKAAHQSIFCLLLQRQRQRNIFEIRKDDLLAKLREINEL